MSWSGSEMKNNVLGDPDFDVDTPIYRIFPRFRLLEMIKTNKNTLVKPRLWDDPFENAFLQSVGVTSGGEDVSLEVLRERWYGQCWTTDKDTDAMWRIYSQNKDGVRVKTTVRKIFSGLWCNFKPIDAAERCFMGKVEYLERASIEEKINSYKIEYFAKSKNTANTLLLKRNEFKHESEVRILYQDIQSGSGDVIYQYDFNFKSLIEEVTIDPRATSDELNMFSDYFSKIGVTAPVNQSGLYSFTPGKIKFSS